MHPTEVPQRARDANPDLKFLVITAPPGVPEEECGSVEALAGQVQTGIFDGGPIMREYWVLEEGDIEHLKAGGLLELTFFSNGMPMHGMKVI
jgi:hypothetical protein